MLRSTSSRLLTTHTGSLPRPAALREAPAGGDARETAVAAAVRDVVARQVQAGIDVVSDGEMSKDSYATYITRRASGFGGEGKGIARRREAEEFPEWAAAASQKIDDSLTTPACVGDVAYADLGPVARDLVNLQDAVTRAGAPDAFLTAASPGVITKFLENQHYPSHEAYLEALVPVMRTEYEAIHAAGVTVQIDCPDLANGHHTQFPDLSLPDWKRVIEGHVAAINAATEAIPADAMRLHVCWGNYDGPHNHDVELAEIVEILLRARPAGLSFEAANPRHAHEWRVWEDVALPEDKVLIPGVIDSTTNYVEHPELVAERLGRFVSLIGAERVIGGTDCGFGTFADYVTVYESVAYAKLAALAQGAALASARRH